MTPVVRITLTFLATALSACTSTNFATVTPVSPHLVPAAELIGEWNLDWIDEKQVQPRHVTMQFSTDGHYRASVACNEINAQYVVSQNMVTLRGPLRGTEKECVPAPAYEDLITNALYGAGGPWTLRFDGRDNLKLLGRYQLSLSRVRR